MEKRPLDPSMTKIQIFYRPGRPHRPGGPPFSPAPFLFQVAGQVGRFCRNQEL